MKSMAPDERIGAYGVVRLLDRGGMGVVYEAIHEQLGTRCALKVFDTESGNIDFLRKRFLAEGKMLARLKHPRIVHVFDLGVDEATNTPYFAMDLILSPSGTPKTLEDARNEGVTEAQVESWLKDICDGLDYIHGKGVVHRDVKLENVLIGPDGHAMISDFGIARIFDEEFRSRINLTLVTKVDDDGFFRMGTGMYMAPELRQRDAKATPASDAWSLGVLLFRLLTGVWYEKESRLLGILDGYERPWKSLITRLCGANPADRVPAAGLASLVPLLSAKERWRPREKWLLLISVGFALVICVPCWLLLKNSTSRDQAGLIPGTDGEDIRLKADIGARLNDIKKEASTRAKSFRDLIQKEISKCEEVTAEASKYLEKVRDDLPGYLKPLETQELLDARAFASGTSASREVKRELPECPTLASRATLEEVNGIWRKAYTYEARAIRVERLAEEIAKAVDSATSADGANERSLPKMNLALSITTSQLAEMRDLMQQPQGATILEMRYPWTYVSKMCEEATDHFRSRFLPAVKAFEMKTFQDGLILTKYIGGADRFDVPSEIDGKRVLKIGGGNFERFSAAVFSLKWIRNSANINLKHGGVWNKYASTDFSKQVALHDGLRIIGKNAFQGTDIHYAVFPEGLCAIGDGAFQGCERLALVGMPTSLRYIGEQAFKGCNNLFIDFSGDAPLAHANAFEDVPPHCTVHVRRDSKGWNVPIPGTWKGLRIEYTKDSATTNDVLQKKSDVSAKVFADEVAPTNGLVAYYPFNGDTKDASGNGNHGINHGAVLAKDRYGRPDGAYYFSFFHGMDGVHIEVPDSASLNSPSNAVTISAWIRSDVDWYVKNKNGKQSWLSVVCKGRTKRQYSLQIDAGTQKIWLMLGDRSCRDAVRGSSNYPKRGEWYHVAMTYDGTKQVAYLDGEVVGHKMSKGQLDAAGEPLFIGRDTPGEEEVFKGTIDDVRIYNRALSEYEISILFLSELAVGAEK